MQNIYVIMVKSLFLMKARTSFKDNLYYKVNKKNRCEENGA
jgi:hypothetical protein